MRTKKLFSAVQLCALKLLLGMPIVVCAQAGVGGPAAVAGRTQLENYLLLALSPSEEVAVLRGADGQLVTLRVGSTLAPARARLAQVMGDRLRFETYDDKGVRQTAWMIRAGSPEQAPEVQRISSAAPAVLSAAGNVLPASATAAAQASDTPAKKR